MCFEFLCGFLSNELSFVSLFHSLSIYPPLLSFSFIPRLYEASDLHSSHLSQPVVLKMSGQKETITETWTRPYTCKHCGQWFSKRCDLYEHKFVHTGDNRSLCDICGKRIRCLKSHQINVHSGILDWWCVWCNKGFDFQKNLIVQEDHKKFFCEDCGKPCVLHL